MRRMVKYGTILLLCYLALSRFFTETLGLLPKWFDIGELFLLPAYLLAVAVSVTRPEIAHGWKRVRFPLLALLVFSLAFAIAWMANYSHVHPPAALFYLWSFLLPPLAGVSLSLLAEDWRIPMVRAILILGLLQFAVIALWQLPPFFRGKIGQDAITGTFGLNATQLAPFLFLFGGTAAHRLMDAGRAWGTAVLLFLLGGVFVLLSFRFALPALLVCIPVLLLALGKRHGVPPAKILAASGGLVCLAALAIWAGTRLFPILQYDAFLFYADAGRLARTGKVAGYLQGGRMLAAHPAAALTGTGPGTMVSRGFTMFAREPLYAAAPRGVGAYAAAWRYPADKYHPYYLAYMAPVWRQDSAVVDFTAGQAGQPTSSILSLLLETGLAGLLPFLFLYLLCIRRAFRETAAAGMGGPLATGLLAASTFIFIIGWTGDYWEISRIACPLWLTYGVLTAAESRNTPLSKAK